MLLECQLETRGPQYVILFNFIFVSTLKGGSR